MARAEPGPGAEPPTADFRGNGLAVGPVDEGADLTLRREHPLADTPFLGGVDESGVFGEFPVGFSAAAVGHDVECEAVADGGE